jgi:putative salt-induced outer membrane protein YdiY
MTPLAFLLASLLAAQPAPSGAASDAAAADAAARAAAAAEKAATAAAVAAEAALRAAEAAARVSAVLSARFEVPAAPATAPPAPPPPPSAWSGTVGLGFISLTGNSRTVTFTANVAAERKSTDWIASTKAYGNYGQNRSATTQDTETVAEAAGLLLRLDRRFATRYTAYVLGGVETDHVKSVELRSAGELGATIVWVDAKGDTGWTTSLRTDLGFRVSEERRYQYFPTAQEIPDVTLYAPRAGLAFAYAVSKDVVFTEDAEVMPNVVGDSRVLVNSVSKISTRLSRTLAFGIAYKVAYDSAPAPEKVSTDTTLALTLDVLL